MAVIDARLRELAPEIEFARGPGGHWFGVFTMQPLGLSDRHVSELLKRGLLHVIEWDDGPNELRRVVDFSLPAPCLRAVRTRSRPCRARLSTDGWAVLAR